ncbi:MAG: acyl-CoA dehydrogenase family protein [Acidilobaceae archaeon]
MPLSTIKDISLAYGLNFYSIDKPLRDVLRFYIGREPDLYSIGAFSGTDIYEAAYRVDQLSKPALITWSIKGDRVDTVWLDSFERIIIEKLILDYGANRFPFNGGSWHEHFASINLIGDPGVGCILTISIQTAYTLYKYGGDPIRGYYRNLSGLSKPLMIGATWFTEIQGGSDLGANTTIADRVNGVWRLNGYKYFASGAGLADIALVTARSPGAPKGAKGISLFAVPRLRSDGKLNFYVRRLKVKSGTVSVPTGEVELIDSDGYIIGEPSKGIYYALESLMVSRLSNSHGAIGISRKAYFEALLYALERKAFGKRLVDHLLVQRDLLEMESLIEAGLILVHKATREFEESKNDTPPYTSTYHYARLLTHIAKNITAEIASRVTQLAMELFGGVGFLSEYPVERWHREALITPIWEGTSNIQALDMLEVIAKKGAHETLISDMREKAKETIDPEVSRRALKAIEETISSLAFKDPSLIEYEAKDTLDTLGYAISVILLENLASHIGERRYSNIAKVILDRMIDKKPIPRLKQSDIIEIIGIGTITI